MMRAALATLLVMLAASSSGAFETEIDGKKIEVPFCGGFAGLACRANEWCDYPDGAVCGIGDYPGKCQPRPTHCIRVFIPVCGCDGRTYGNWCEANAAGSDVAYKGACAERE